MRLPKPTTASILAGALTMACGEPSSPTSPGAIDGTALSGLGGPDAAPSVSVATMTSTATAGADGIGSNDVGVLSRTAQDISFSVDATNLTPGYAYSVWWIVFEKPQFCEDGCNGPDLSNPRVQGSVFNGGGAVADWKGHATFAATTQRHDPGDSFLVRGNGVTNTLKAEIHLLFRSHGAAEADADDVALQITTPNQFCNLAPGPDQGPPGCKDVGFLAFPRP